MMSKAIDRRFRTLVVITACTWLPAALGCLSDRAMTGPGEPRAVTSSLHMRIQAVNGGAEAVTSRLLHDLDDVGRNSVRLQGVASWMDNIALGRSAGAWRASHRTRCCTE